MESCESRLINALWAIVATIFFFLLNMLWSRHVKPSPAKGEKSEISDFKEIKVCTNWTIPETVNCTNYAPLYKWLNYKVIIANQRCYAKNLPKQTQQCSVHLDQQVEHRQEVAVSTAVADERRRSKCSTREWPSNSPHFFFFWRSQAESWSSTLTLNSREGSQVPSAQSFSLYLLLPSFIFFIFIIIFFLMDSPPSPPKGGGDSKRSSEHEQIEHSTNPLASTRSVGKSERCFAEIGPGGERRMPRRLCLICHPGQYCRDPVAGACCQSHRHKCHGITLFRAYESPEGRGEGRVVWASRFRGPGMASEECWGASLHQLVHNPETGDATGSCSLAGRSCFFFFAC